jgi:P-type conjugative transfer protein TrbJ
MKKAKLILCSVAFSAAAATLPVQAGIPVIDGGNLTQNILTAFESIAQTAKQIQQYEKQVLEYQTQLEQYENQLLHSLAPVASIWDAATTTMDKLVAAQNTLDFYQNKLGSLERYLDKYQDADYYRNSPCFTAQGCSDSEMRAMRENLAMSSQAQKKSNDAVFKSIEQQQVSLKADARTLVRLQQAAKSAEGQLQAIGYANQLASNQTMQLLQMRSLMVAQNNAEASHRQAAIDIEAKQQAAHEISTENRYKPTQRPLDWTQLHK